MTVEHLNEGVTLGDSALPRRVHQVSLFLYENDLPVGALLVTASPQTAMITCRVLRTMASS